MSSATRIIGTWHSTSVSGDAVGIAVDNVAAEFDKNKEFKATVNLTIGGPDIYQGNFDARQMTLTLHPKTGDPIHCKVTFQTPQQMTILAEKSGVTAIFKRGKAPEQSGGWF